MRATAIREVKPKPMVQIKSKESLYKKSAHNAEYFAMIDKSLKEIEEGKIVEVSAEEMRRILSE